LNYFADPKLKSLADQLDFESDLVVDHLQKVLTISSKMENIEKSSHKIKSTRTVFVQKIAFEYYKLIANPTSTEDGPFMQLIRMLYYFMGWATEDAFLSESIYPKRAVTAALRVLSYLKKE